MKRFRIKYAKKEALKYTSGLEVQKIWERALRRGHLPVAYSQGFHPQPRLNQAAPLPLGFTSTAEWIDIWFQDSCTQAILGESLPRLVPSGFEILEVNEIALSVATMQNNILSAAYRVQLLEPYNLDDIQKQMERILNAGTLIRTRRTKEYDLRPLIEELRLVESADEFPCFYMKLAARPGATGRPEEVLLEMNIDPMASSSEKIDLLFNPEI